MPASAPPTALFLLLAASTLACATGEGIKMSFQKNKVQREARHDLAQDPPAPQPEHHAQTDVLDAPASPGHRASLLEMACLEDDAAACRDFALAVMQASTRPDDLERASQAMRRACEAKLGQACYEHALMLWLRVGGPYDPERLILSMEHARELGQPHAAGGYAELIAPAPLGQSMATSTRPHYVYACEELWLGKACDLLDADAQLQRAQSQTLPTFAPPPASPPVQVSLAAVHVAGPHAEDAVRAKVQSLLPQLQFCVSQSTLAVEVGQSAWTLSLGPEAGEVRAVLFQQSPPGIEAVAACARPFVESWRFGPAEAPSVVMLSLNFATSDPPR